MIHWKRVCQQMQGEELKHVYKSEKKMPADCCNDFMCMYAGSISCRQSLCSLRLFSSDKGKDCKSRKLRERCRRMEIHLQRWDLSQKKLEKNKK